jgi:parvulin-like peptidyl-prolyl isomerase
MKMFQLRRLVALWIGVSFFVGAVHAQVPLQDSPLSVPDDAVVAKVDGQPVTAGEIRRSLQIMPPEFSRMYEQNPKLAVQQLYMMRHLANDAEKAKLDQQSPVKEQLEFMRANALANAMVSYEHNNFIPSPESIQNYYAANSARFQQAKVKVISITFKPEGTGNTGKAGGSIEEIARAAVEAAAANTQRNEETARKLADEVVAKIRTGGDFAKLAAEYTDDPKYKTNGGDFGTVGLDSPQPDPLKRMIFEMKPGEISDPWRQPAAYYIFRLEEKKIPAMNEVSEPVIQEIKKQHLNEWMQTTSKRFEPAVENPKFFMPTPRMMPSAPLAAPKSK